MENRIKILEPIIVLVTCADGSLLRYTDYYYCGNGLLCYQRYEGGYECRGKLYSNCEGTYYIPYKYLNRKECPNLSVSRIVLLDGYTLDDFRADKVIDDDTFETSHLSKEGFPWFDVLKQQAEKNADLYMWLKTLK